MPRSNELQQFEIFFELLPQIMFVTDKGGRAAKLNRHWYEYTGHAVGASPPEDWGKYIHPDDVPEMIERFKKARLGNHAWEYAYRLQRADGIYRWHLGRATPFFDSHGEFSKWVGTATDIEDQKRAEELLKGNVDLLEEQIANRTNELRRANGFLDSVIENIPNMIFVKDATDLKFVRFNRAGEDLIGISRTELIGKSDLELFPKDEADAFIKADREVIRQGHVVDIPEEPISTQALGMRTLHTKKIPVYDEKGKPRYLLGISEDITDFKKLERERIQLLEEKIAAAETKKSTDRFQFLSKASAVLGSSLEFEKTLTNLSHLTVPDLADWCGVQLIESDRSLRQIAVAHKDPKMVKLAERFIVDYPVSLDAPNGAGLVMRTGQSELYNEIPAEMIDAAALNDTHRDLLRKLDLYSYLCVPIRVGSRVIGALTLASTRMSMRKYSEQDRLLAEDLGERAGFAVENARLYKEAKHLNRVKDEFLATLSHELRTPLNVVLGHAEILISESDLSASDARNSVDAIMRNARSQMTIIGDLLDVSSIITGKVSFRPTKAHAKDLVEKAIEAIEPVAQAKRVRIRTALDKPSCEVTVDPARFQQILFNLLSNAIKFTPEGKSVEVGVVFDKTSWTLTVKDQGQGIDPDFLPYVFDRFRQEDSSTSRRHGGLGLGLSIVRSLAELHGGGVVASSAGLGQGASFAVKFPLDGGRNQTTAEVLGPTRASAGSANREFEFEDIQVLLVEDSADNRALLQRMLAKKGMKVAQAESPSQARALLKTLKPDLIISDIGMPDENGLEFMRRLRGTVSAEDVPSIALTAYVREEEKEAAISAGFQAHVAKPVTPADLFGAIADVLKI